MPKIIAIPNSIDELNEIIDLIDGFIIGIENMCVNTSLCMNINKLDILDKYKHKDIFVSINKNMHNNDLNLINDILKKLNNYDIKGVLYYDVAVLNIYNTLNLKYDLVLAAEHSTTNYNTINYWNKHNVNYTYLSSDITEGEIVTISKNCKTELMVTLFGYLPMFVSKRHIVKNYFEYFDLNNKSNINYIEKENKLYPIIDNQLGTYVYSNNILNGIRTSLNIDVEYIILNLFNINLDKSKRIIEMFKTVDNKNLDIYDKEINDMFNNIDDGFLNTKTIYKVKKNAK